MKKEIDPRDLAWELLDAIGDADETLIEDAGKEKQAKRRSYWGRRRAWVALSAAAACLVAAIVLPVSLSMRKGTDSPFTSSMEVGSTDIGAEIPEARDIWVYFVMGGELERKAVHMDDTAPNRFDAWRDANGMGSDVQLIGVSVWDNGESGESNGMAWHEVGDTFFYRLTVSDTLRKYYGEHEEALLRSLQLTMTEDVRQDYDVYQLYLQSETGNQVLEAADGRNEDEQPPVSKPEDTSHEESSGEPPQGGESSGEPPQSGDSPAHGQLVFASGINLMENIHPTNVETQKADDAFLQQQLRFSLALFQAVAKQERADGNSLLLSPLSAQYALSMAANGAAGQTQKEMLSLLAGSLPLEKLNGYLHTLMGDLLSNDEKCKVNIANAIWYNEDVQVYENFLQTNADYYGAGAYRSPFNEETRQAINAWAYEQTDGLVPQALKEIDEEAALYLLNATLFDAEWRSIFYEDEVLEKPFTAYNGETQTASLMYSDEYIYYDDGLATGFAKPYKGDQYAFVALLPNEDVDVYDYVSSLTPEGLLRTLQNGVTEEVVAGLPKFSGRYDAKLSEILPALGMESAFAPGADFSAMMTGFDGKGHLKDVTQTTVISVGEMGTKAAAVTITVEAPDAWEEPAVERHDVILDRPFVYLIVDTETNLPLFMGVQTEVDASDVPEGEPPAIEGFEEEPEPEPPMIEEAEEDYTGLTVSVSPVTEEATVLKVCLENNREKDFRYHNEHFLLRRKTEDGYEDFPYIGNSPVTYGGGIWPGETKRSYFRLEKDFGVQLRAGETYRLLLTNVEDGQLFCEFTVGSAEGNAFSLTIQTDPRIRAGQTSLLFHVQNDGELDFVYCHAEILLEHLTEDGWESFSRLEVNQVSLSDMAVPAGEFQGTVILPADYGVVLESGETYRLALANAPGVYGEFTVE